jgi:hypothetical protein
MANRTAWIAGNGVGFTWTTAINGSDLVSLANGSTVLSSVADIANQTNLDIYADVSVLITIASSAIAAGAYLGLCRFDLQTDGATYGDGSLTAGTPAAIVPPFTPVGAIPLRVATYTVLSGMCTGIVIPPGSFRFAMLNACGFAFTATAGNNVVKYRTYNMNLNN